MLSQTSEYSAEHAHGLMFHRFHRANQRPSGQGSISSAEFEKLLDLIPRDRILDPDTWIENLVGGRLAPDKLCITLDDGLKSQYDVALPILEYHNLKAFWFVFSSVLEGGVDRNEAYSCFATECFKSFDDFVYMFLDVADITETVFSTRRYVEFETQMRTKFSFYSVNDIRFRYVRNYILVDQRYHDAIERCMKIKETNISDFGRLWLNNRDLLELTKLGHVIGLHSYRHPFVLANLPEEEQSVEYNLNFKHILGVTGQAPNSVSHPFGSYSRTTLDTLLELGVVCGFRSSMSSGFDIEDQRLANLQIPREDGINLVR